MRMRCQAEGIGPGYRDGTFEPIRHANQGYEPDGKPSVEHQVNRATCQRNVGAIRDRNAHRDEGLNSLQFEILERGPIMDGNGQPYPHAERVLVGI
jgi:hypothetical protein